MPIVATHLNPWADSYRADGYWPQLSIGSLFASTTKRLPDNLALVDETRRFSFAALAAIVDRVAGGLRDHGFGPGDVVAYQLPNWWETVAVFLAATRIGATANPLLPTFREPELSFTLRQSGAQALVIPGVFRGCDHRQLIGGLRNQLPQLREVFVARADGGSGVRSFSALCEAASLQRAADVDPDSISLLMYTSGTTADPKGVLHTHNSLAAEVMSLQRVHQLTPADRTLMPSPLTHISGLLHGILTPALLGTGAVLMERWLPEVALQLIAAEGITYMVGAPTFVQDLLGQPVSPGDVRSLRLFSCGGAGVSPSLMQKARAAFPACVAKRVYGSTEFPTLTTTGAEDALTRGIDSEGRAIAPAQVRIADSAGTALPIGAEGEVQGRGPECFVGYLDDSLNADSFTADGWFRSADLGVLDAAGYLRITGRLKEIIIRKGEKISVKELEDLIATHPAIAEVAVIPRPDADTGERACAVVRLHPSAAIDLPTLTAFLAGKGLAKQKWPEQILVVDEFPRTESGKIIRPKLREQIG